jgi:hypothetical protein
MELVTSKHKIEKALIPEHITEAEPIPIKMYSLNHKE